MDDRFDQQLINDYLKGDKNALEILISRHFKAVYALVYHLVGNIGDAEDITQEVFVKAWRNLKKFDCQRNFKPWIFRIAKNTCVDFWRKRKNIAFSAMSWEGQDDWAGQIVDPAPLPPEIWEKQNLAEQLAMVLQQLPLNDRLVLVLHYNDHLTFLEISEALGAPLDTVKSRHRRAIIKLRKLLIR